MSAPVSADATGGKWAMRSVSSLETFVAIGDDEWSVLTMTILSVFESGAHI